MFMFFDLLCYCFGVIISVFAGAVRDVERK